MCTVSNKEHSVESVSYTHLDVYKRQDKIHCTLPARHVLLQQISVSKRRIQKFL